MKRAALLSLILLTSCSHMVWVKNGASQAEFEQIKAECLLEGMGRVPQDNRTVMTSQGGVYTTQHCQKTPDGKWCGSDVQVQQPTYAVVDQNEGVRNQIVRACFFRNGWNEMEVKNEDGLF